MSYARQRLGLPLLFLWALAHGMWIGAAWHASTQHANFTTVCQKTCNCSASALPVLSGTTAAVSPNCPVCQLGLTSPDVALQAGVAELPRIKAPQSRPFASTEVLPSDLIALPPSRGPPLA
jgi:hypothetical protein